MIDFRITIDASAALNALDRMEDSALYQKMATVVADEDVLPALHKYPQPSRKKQPFKSDKQRRFVMAGIRKGFLEVPYRRSGDTGRSYQKRAIPDGIEVYSDRPSAAYTRGSGDIEQAAYHKGTWPTHEKLAESLEADAALTATGVIVKVIGDAG